MQNGLAQLSLFRQFSAPEVLCAEEFCKMFLGNKVRNKTFLRYASVVSIKNIGYGKNECDWVPL